MIILEPPYPLVELESKVFETAEDECFWYFGDPFLGVEVDDERDLDELTSSFYFVLPRLESGDGVLSLLTIARGLPGDSSGMAKLWDPVELREVLGGIYVHVTYDPSRSLFEVSMNAGSESRELRGVILGGADPELVCGRVLELYVEISHGRIFASVQDRFAGGDLAFDDEASSTGGSDRPWGAAPSGCWWVFCGVTDVRDDRGSALPPGFGLSDLRITLGSEIDDVAGSLAYHGTLDHLVAPRPQAPDPMTEQESRSVSAEYDERRNPCHCYVR